MTGEQFRQMIREVAEDLCAMNENKGTEYAGEDNALGFFLEQAQELGMSAERGWSVLARKHWRSITTFCRNSEGEQPVLSEPIEGRAKDLILYLLLFIALQREPDPTLEVDNVDEDDERELRPVRHERETRDEFIMFSRFVDLGPDRTLGRLAERTPIGPAELQKISDRCEWFQRAEAIDDSRRGDG